MTAKPTKDVLSVEKVLIEALSHPESFFLGKALENLLTHAEGGGSVKIKNAIAQLRLVESLEEQLDLQSKSSGLSPGQTNKPDS